MKHEKSILGIVAALGMMILILDGQTALSGAGEGIELCLRTVIPSLFPFFALSIALTSSLTGMQIPLLRPLGKLCKIPLGTEAILLTGFLGGYPVGAQAVFSAYHAGQLRKNQANRMLSFCSNAGPSFIFGMIASQFPGMLYPWLLWGIHLLSAVLVAVVLPEQPSGPAKVISGKRMTTSEIMKKSILVMANVCGWVIVFRVILSFLNRWVFWALPVPIQVLFSGILELANGCCSLRQVENVGLKFLLSAGMLSFGGICVAMQTASVIGDLSIRHYLTGKLLQTLFCLLLALACQGLFPREIRLPVAVSACYLALVVLSVMVLFAVKRQKNSSNPVSVGV